MERFWSKVEKSEGCWEWKAGKNQKGYGEFRYEGAKRYAHRVAFHLKNGKWPTDCLMHTCDNPSCVNLEHLVEGSRSDNNKDMFWKGRGNPKIHSGEMHPRSVKVDANQVLNMRKIGMTYRQITAAIGISHGAISRIIRGTHWSMR